MVWPGGVVWWRREVECGRMVWVGVMEGWYGGVGWCGGDGMV